MRVFTEQDFTWCDGDLMVSEASYLGMPPGCVMRQFQVEGIGLYTYQGLRGDTLVYTCTDSPVIIQVFND